ncbi:unnamed protein product [Effrenium voratum]|uniref:Uncharacterized protein n=1 Tax=Effrenium voratum TaxID=2562239 RepID=A0AA36NIZ2_9DINO|nr:unnamed protein product [Effrenium voratum]
MAARRRGRGACLSFLGIVLALSLWWPSTESPFAAHDFAGGARVRPHPLHAGVALRAAAQEDRLDLEEVVAEAERVLEDNGTMKEIKAVLRKARKIYPGKWTLLGLKDELQQELREFVEEAKAASKGLKEVEKAEKKVEKAKKEEAAVQINTPRQECQQELVQALEQQFGSRRPDRFEWPSRLTTGSFSFKQTKQRKEAFGNLFRLWEDHAVSTTQREKLSLPAVPSAPGMGKSRFAWLCATKGRLSRDATVDNEWQETMDTISNLTFKQSLEKAVGVAVSFNCDAAPVPGEEPQFMLGVRMVFGHFLDATKTPFPKFLAWLRRLQRLEITETEAWEMIDRDVWEHFQESRDMILTVDEPLQLRALITSAMRLITAGRVHVLMTSLSGADLDEAANGRTVHFLGFQRLDKEAVDNLVEAEDEKTRSRLKGARFEFLLRECAGVPRLIEKVFEVARSPAMNDKSSCDAIRVWVGTKFQQLSKYKNRNHRSAALVSALSFHAQSQAREDQTRAAEREGYLFDGLIPPLLLKWWWVGPDEQGVLDEAHALLKSACEICAMSDVLGGAQHGPNFEKQMASLWKMLTITDSIFRREEGRGQPRSILGMLGGNRLPAASRMVSRYSAAAAFDKPLREVATWSLLKSKEEFQGDLPVRMELNTCYFPKSPSYSGFDFALLEPYGDQGVLVLVECKFSKELATTKLSTEDIVNKFVLALRNCPNIQGFLAEGRLCFVIGGLRECTVDVEAAATEIVGKLKKEFDISEQQVHSSLIVLHREHTKALLRPTLSCLPPFAEL